MYSILFLTVASFVSCLLLTPPVREWSRRSGMLDRPNAARKRHAVPTPRTGGLAIGLAYLLALGMLLISPLHGADRVSLPLAIGLVPGAAVVFIVGLLDDLYGLRPWTKLCGQIAAACLAYAGGVHVAAVAGVAAGWWSLPLTIVWLVACSNAFNLIDGMDGLATGIGLCASFTTLAAALLQHNLPLALATAPLVGALAAFLRYNFNPASIFLGDCGSLTVGFLLGCFAAVWSQKSATLLGMTAPLLALSVPLLDTAISVVRRFVRRQPIFGPDHDHLHHRLLDRGWSPRKVSVALYAVCSVAAAFSLLLSWPDNHFSGLLLVIFCIAVWIGVQLVGYVEFETTRHLILNGTFRHVVNARLFVDIFERKVAAAKTADDYWLAIREVATEFDIPYARLLLGPKTFEHLNETANPDRCCSMRIPLSDAGYVTFRYPAGASVRQAVVMMSIAAILQRSYTLPPGVLTAATTSTGDPILATIQVGNKLGDGRAVEGRVVV